MPIEMPFSSGEENRNRKSTEICSFDRISAPEKNNTLQDLLKMFLKVDSIEKPSFQIHEIIKGTSFRYMDQTLQRRIFLMFFETINGSVIQISNL